MEIDYCTVAIKNTFHLPKCFLFDRMLYSLSKTIFRHGNKILKYDSWFVRFAIHRAKCSTVFVLLSALEDSNSHESTHGYM